MVLDYEAACKQAASAQGLDPIAEVLTEEGVEFGVAQTGGFCMVITVPVHNGVYGIIDDSTEEDTKYLVCFYAGDSWTEGGEEEVVATYPSLDFLRVEAGLFREGQIV